MPAFDDKRHAFQPHRPDRTRGAEARPPATRGGGGSLRPSPIDAREVLRSVRLAKPDHGIGRVGSAIKAPGRHLHQFDAVRIERDVDVVVIKLRPEDWVDIAPIWYPVKNRPG